jgi:aminoglycoside phosphotransferase (APT) family kinase protein
MRMHSDQVDIDEETVAALVAAQFPDWQGLPVRRVTSHGTVNALFRLGDDVLLRFPLRPGPERREELLAEQDHARRLTGKVPLEVPEPLALGEPGDGYPGPWAAYRWIPGEIASDRTIGDADAFAADLAGFARAVHRLDTEGRSWDGRSRGGPLRSQDDWVRHSLAQSKDLTDTEGITAIWERCLEIPHADADVWIHADLMPGNLLVRDGRLVAVIDVEGMCVGDPAVDLMPAWNLLAAGPRASYQRAMAVDDATWERGRGWAIVQAIGCVWYYVDTNPVMAETARHTLAAVLEG